MPAMDSTSFTDNCEEYKRYYSDQYQMFCSMERIVKELFDRLGLAGALEIAQTSSKRDSLYLNLKWRPIYPYAYEDKRHDSDEEYDYKNVFLTEFFISANGINGDYNYMLCFNMRNANNILTSSDHIPVTEAEIPKMAVPSWFIESVKKITKETLKKNQMNKNIPPKPSIFQKIKASVALGWK